MASSLYQLHSPWVSISWKGSSPDQPLRFVLIARKGDDSRSLELVELPGSAGCRSYLAAQVDAQEKVFDWFEVQLQTPEALTQSPAALSGFLNNAVLDAEWEREGKETADQHLAFADADPAEPWGIDPETFSVTRLFHRKTGAPLVLCQDDGALEKAAKPSYRGSLQRWFKSVAPSGEIVWLELGSSGAEARAELVLEKSGSDHFIAFNLSAGKLRVRRHGLLSLQAAIDLLREKHGLKSPAESSAIPSEANLSTLLTQEVVRAVDRPSIGGAPSSATQLSALEKLYHLLNLWKDAVQVVAKTSSAAQRPFLNLGLDSFRASFGPSRLPSHHSPILLELVKPTDAIPVEIEPGNLQFIPCTTGEEGRTMERFGGWRMGAGTIRFSQISDGGAGLTRIEGVLDGALLRDSTEASLVWVQMTLEGRSLSFLAKLDGDQAAGARAGVRFRASISSLAPELTKALKSTLAPRRPCHFSVLQPISPAQDIYQLGRIGLRSLLANTDEGLLEVEDDLFELASLVPPSSGIAQLKALAETPDLNDRLRRLLSAETWFPDVTTPSIPPDLWLAVLRELIEFVAVEEHPAEGSAGPSDWVRPLLLRSTALERVVVHVEGLLWTPRAIDEEIARIVHRFLPS